MNPLVYLTMFGMPLAIVYLFRWLPSTRAFTVSFVAGFLFLPQATFPIPGLPPYSRMAAVTVGVFLGTLLFDIDRIRNFRPSWIDIPLIMWCISPFLASVSNDLGLYDGFREASDHFLSWGAPYFLGRMYLTNYDALRKLAIDIFVGALLYVPFCLYEFRTGPQAHFRVYGFQTASFIDTVRKVGFRPVVFLTTGLMTGVWLMAATLLGGWLLSNGVIRKLWNIPFKWVFGIVTFILILAQSMNAIFSTLIGFGMLYATRWLRTSIPLLILIFAIPTYLYFPATGNFNGDGFVTFVEQTLGPERAFSIKTRFNAEEILVEKARERMVFGWGGWGRNRVIDESGKDAAITDSLWVLTYGTTGLVGLVSFVVTFLLPSLFFTICYPARLWSDRRLAPAAAFAVIVPLYMLDCVLNAMPNAVLMIANGGIANMVLLRLTTNLTTGLSLPEVQQYMLPSRPTPSQFLPPPESGSQSS